jgi:hypothetical protein
VFGSRVAVAIASSIITAVVVAGGIAWASVPNNSVNSRKIVNNTVQSVDIRNGTVQSADIHNGSIKLVDLAPAARPVPSSLAVVHISQVTNNTGGNITINWADGTQPDCFDFDVGVSPRCSQVVPLGVSVRLFAGYPDVEWGADAASCGTSMECTIVADGNKDVALTVNPF